MKLNSKDPSQLSLITKSTLDIIGFTDSDWAGDNTDHKSTFSYSLSIGSKPIC
jgi:hypothetical protein